ncbi:MAG TPA: sugar transferase [candidate division Zixibacteria bacterium]|nr:sugar transferase [candidate division Zixibacteria bacterium]
MLFSRFGRPSRSPRPPISVPLSLSLETPLDRAFASRTSYAVVKRCLDVVGSAILLVLVAPIMLAIALAIAFDSGLPIIYRGERLGRDGRLIHVLKFRTMRDGSHRHLEELLAADEERRLEYSANRKLKNDPRRTRVGVVLRRTSMDELPQLLNVLMGDMSLIGPRPYMPDELEGRPEAAEILSVSPGITGLWQVNGRSERTFEERLALEVDYVRNRSLLLDLKIAVRTIAAVISGRGAF